MSTDVTKFQKEPPVNHHLDRSACPAYNPRKHNTLFGFHLWKVGCSSNNERRVGDQQFKPVPVAYFIGLIIEEDLTMENGEAVQGDPTDNERRPSIVKLQGVLKRVSQSPFHKQYTNLVSSTSSSESSLNDSIKNQEKAELVANVAVDDHSLSQQNGVLDRDAWNPFQLSPQESSRKTINMEDMKRETSTDPGLSTIFAPPPEFLSSPLDSAPATRTLENTAPPNESPSHGASLNLAGPFKPPPPPRPHYLPGTLKRDGTPQATSTKDLNLFHAPPDDLQDPFLSPSNKEEDIFQSRYPNEADLFHTKGADLIQAPPHKGENASTKENDLFHTPSAGVRNALSRLMDVPFPSPTVIDPFQPSLNMSDPFGPFHPFKDSFSGTTNVFVPPKTQDGFHPSPSTGSSGTFNTIPNRTIHRFTYSTPSFNGSPGTPSDESLDLFKAPLPAPAAPGKPINVILTTPRGTKHDILQPTPFIQARAVSVSSEGDLESEDMTPFRRPPRPLPRRRPSRRVNPIVPELTSLKTPLKPAPKPEIKQKPFSYIGQTLKDSRPEEAANDAVFEDVLLIGQERCVEDWPEDSPQYNPGFKPSGTLRLRRESLRMDSDGSGEDQNGTRRRKKVVRRFSVASLLTRRGSKDKFTEDGKSTSLPRRLRDEDGSRASRSSKDGYGLQEEDLPPYLEGTHSFHAGEDVEKNGMEDKPKKPLKAKVGQMLRRASITPHVRDRAGEETKYMNGHLSQGLKERGRKGSATTRPWSEQGNALDVSFEDEEHEGSGGHGFRKKSVTVKVVPQRGFAIEKDHLETKGAHGHTPGRSSKDDDFLDEGGATGYTPHFSTSEATFMGNECSLRGKDLISPGAIDKENHNGMEDCRPKTLPKPKLPLGIRRKSKMSHESPPSQFRPRRASNEVFQEDGVPQKGADLFSAGKLYEDHQDERPDYYKPKKSSKFKSYKKQRAMNKSVDTEYDHPPGATSKDYYRSEAAEAEWLAAQTDERLAAGSEEGEVDGDTDSLMEWWNTVEQWDELPSDDEDVTMKVDEIKSFTILADKVQRGLCVFNKVFTERAEILWHSVITLHAIADDISAFHKKAKIASISGGTTTAVGGVAAITGLALAPLTFGVSLIITAVGVGVAAAGGIASASAAISDNVNNMQDRKKVELELQEYETHLLDLRKILRFVNQGLFRLRGHPFLRAGTQHYSEDWEVRRAVQIISLVDGPVMRAAEITDEAIASVQGLFKGIDKHFIKDSRELKKGCKKEVVGQIKAVANVLNDGLVELNALREELQDASGNM